MPLWLTDSGFIWCDNKWERGRFFCGTAKSLKSKQNGVLKRTREISSSGEMLIENETDWRCSRLMIELKRMIHNEFWMLWLGWNAFRQQIQCKLMARSFSRVETKNSWTEIQVGRFHGLMIIFYRRMKWFYRFAIPKLLWLNIWNASTNLILSKYFVFQQNRNYFAVVFVVGGGSGGGNGNGLLNGSWYRAQFIGCLMIGQVDYWGISYLFSECNAKNVWVERQQTSGH